MLPDSSEAMRLIILKGASPGTGSFVSLVKMFQKKIKQDVIEQYFYNVRAG